VTTLGTEEDMRSGQTPRGNHRLIYVSDPSNTTGRLSDPATPEELREIVRSYDELAHVDILVQEICHQGWTQFWRSDLCGYDTRPQHQRLIPMMDAGTMPVEVYIDECHRRGMTFLAGFRMNDRHGHNADWFESLSKTHPEWILKGYKPSSPRTADKRSFDIGCALDYTVDSVRDFIFSFMEEAANRFDVDGIELNWHRLPACFPKGQAESSHEIMTGFVRRVRAMLDEAGKAKGRHLLLGARVLIDLEGCRTMGLNVPVWIEDRLIDYVAPGDLGFTDMNAPFDEFVNLAREHDCLVYPQIQAKLGYHHRDIEQTPAHCRAAIQNFYGAGADGYSTQNIFSVDQYETLKSIRDPNQLDSGDRHYVYYALWGPSDGGQVGYGGDFPYSPEEIRLDRSSAGERQTFRFRMCEDLSSGAVAHLTFQADTLPGDQLTVDVNRNVVEPDQIEREAALDGGLEAFRMPLTSTTAVSGDNELGLTLVKGDATGGVILMNEADVYVKVE
tara:strand:+ start:561 stop:2066 length:1506 start_codon:yes stop_codon:yes gene_type:complete